MATLSDICFSVVIVAICSFPLWQLLCMWFFPTYTEQRRREHARQRELERWYELAYWKDLRPWD